MVHVYVYKSNRLCSELIVIIVPYVNISKYKEILIKLKKNMTHDIQPTEMFGILCTALGERMNHGTHFYENKCVEHDV